MRSETSTGPFSRPACAALLPQNRSAVARSTTPRIILLACNLRFRLGEFRADESILARTFGDSSPARISRDVQHWRECQGDAVVRGLDRRRARRALPKDRVERRRFGERNWKDRLVSMQYV